MQNYTQQFGELPSLSMFCYGVWQGLGIIINGKPYSGDNYPH
jgi:hypothetical protein